jgi:hypothetical protein
MQDKYKPNATSEDIKLNILHSLNGYWVSNEGSKTKPNFHVWATGQTHSVCDSAYSEISLAVARCNYLAKAALKKAELKTH